MSNTLKNIFDYQKFESNSKLSKLIKETEERYANAVSLDELDMVVAAGKTHADEQDAKKMMK